jgi:FKBP-type peptidyl-prolyl cis-trans isomerase
LFQLLLPLLLAAAPSAQTPGIPPDKEVVTTESGLKYSVLTPGDQQGTPKTGALVKVNYTGWLTDGTMFDTSVGKKPFEFTAGVGQVIKGWDEGVQLMSKGARFKFTIPPELGYGERGAGGAIPPGATLVFEVELLDFTKLPDLPAADPARQQKTASGLVYEVLEQGQGEPAKAGEKVNMRFHLWNPQGKLLQSIVVN